MGVHFRSQLVGLCTLAVSLTARAEPPSPPAAGSVPDAAKAALPQLPPVPREPGRSDIPSSAACLLEHAHGLFHDSGGLRDQ